MTSSTTINQSATMQSVAKNKKQMSLKLAASAVFAVLALVMLIVLGSQFSFADAPVASAVLVAAVLGSCVASFVFAQSSDVHAKKVLDLRTDGNGEIELF